MLLKISQNSQKSICDRVFFKISCRLKPVTLLKKGLWYRCSPVDFAKFQEQLFYWTPLNGCFRLFQNRFSWLLVYHFTTLLETWMFIQCARDFHLWTVAKYNSDWVCFKHIICFVNVYASLGISRMPSIK